MFCTQKNTISTISGKIGRAVRGTEFQKIMEIVKKKCGIPRGIVDGHQHEYSL